MQAEAHILTVDDLHRGHAILEQLGRGALVTLEGELDVLGRHRLAVVERGALAEHELVHQAVLRGRPRLGQALALGRARHELHERVVHRVEHHERRDQARRLRGIEPRRGQRDVDGPRPIWPGGARGGGRDARDREQGQDDDGGETRGYGTRTREDA